MPNYGEEPHGSEAQSASDSSIEIAATTCREGVRPLSDFPVVLVTDTAALCLCHCY